MTDARRQGLLRQLAGACGLICLLGGFGCAGTRSAASAAPDPASPAEARAEIDRLGQAITSYRVALGLPESDTLAASSGRSERAPAASSDRSERAPAAPEVSEAERAADRLEDLQPVPAPVPPLAAPPTEPSETTSWRWGKRAADDDGCPQPCRLTRAICSAADRICRIAGYLGEADAWQRCRRATASCEEARRVTGAQCNSCRE